MLSAHGISGVQFDGGSIDGRSVFGKRRIVRCGASGFGPLACNAWPSSAANPAAHAGLPSAGRRATRWTVQLVGRSDTTVSAPPTSPSSLPRFSDRLLGVPRLAAGAGDSDQSLNQVGARGSLNRQTSPRSAGRTETRRSVLRRLPHQFDAWSSSMAFGSGGRDPTKIPVPRNFHRKNAAPASINPLHT